MEKYPLINKLEQTLGMEFFQISEVFFSDPVFLAQLKESRSSGGIRIQMDITVSQLLKRSAQFSFDACQAVTYSNKAGLDGKIVCLVIHEGNPLCYIEVLTAAGHDPLVSFTCTNVTVEQI